MWDQKNLWELTGLHSSSYIYILAFLELRLLTYAFFATVELSSGSIDGRRTPSALSRSITDFSISVWPITLSIHEPGMRNLTYQIITFHVDGLSRVTFESSSPKRYNYVFDLAILVQMGFIKVSFVIWTLCISHFCKCNFLTKFLTSTIVL